MLRLRRRGCGILLDFRADIAFDLWLWDNISLDLWLGDDVAFNNCFRDCILLDRRIIPRKDKTPAAAAREFRAVGYNGVVLVVPRNILFSGDMSHRGWLHPRAHVSYMEISVESVSFSMADCRFTYRVPTGAAREEGTLLRSKKERRMDAMENMVGLLGWLEDK